MTKIQMFKYYAMANTIGVARVARVIELCSHIWEKPELKLGGWQALLLEASLAASLSLAGYPSILLYFNKLNFT